MSLASFLLIGKIAYVYLFAYIPMRLEYEDAKSYSNKTTPYAQAVVASIFAFIDYFILIQLNFLKDPGFITDKV